MHYQAQEIAVPVDVHMPLFSRVLSFDRNFDRSGRDSLVLCIVYQRTIRQSLLARDEVYSFIQKHPSMTMAGYPIAITECDLSGSMTLSEQVAKHNPDILYVTPLRGISIDSVTAVSRSASRLTMTGVLEYVQQGVAVGVEIKGERPQLVINLSAARAEGADFASYLLRSARVVP
jgi:hypothetical protein